MSADEKVQVLERVEASPGSKRKVMAELGVQEHILPLESEAGTGKAGGSIVRRQRVEPTDSRRGIGSA